MGYFFRRAGKWRDRGMTQLVVPLSLARLVCRAESHFPLSYSPALSHSPSFLCFQRCLCRLSHSRSLRGPTASSRTKTQARGPRSSFTRLHAPRNQKQRRRGKLRITIPVDDSSFQNFPYVHGGCFWFLDGSRPLSVLCGMKVRGRLGPELSPCPTFVSSTPSMGSHMNSRSRT